MPETPPSPLPISLVCVKKVVRPSDHQQCSNALTQLPLHQPPHPLQGHRPGHIRFGREDEANSLNLECINGCSISSIREKKLQVKLIIVAFMSSVCVCVTHFQQWYHQHQLRVSMPFMRTQCAFSSESWLGWLLLIVDYLCRNQDRELQELPTPAFCCLSRLYTAETQLFFIFPPLSVSLSLLHSLSPSCLTELKTEENSC